LTINQAYANIIYNSKTKMLEEIQKQPITPELSASLVPSHLGELALDVETRNDWLDAQLNGDPSRPLPSVELKLVDKEKLVVAFDDGSVMPERTPTPGIPSSHYDVNDSHSRRIGFVVMKESPAVEGQKTKQYIGDIKVIDEKQGQGYGQATYLAILKNLPPHTGLRTEGALSPDAKKMWQRMTDAGVARRIGDEDRAPAEYETIL
jgi:hypothetical protein